MQPFGPSPITDPLIPHWNRSSWQNPGPVAGLATGTLHAVSADSRANARAAGDDAHGHTVAVRLDGTTWSTTALPAAAASGARDVGGDV